MDFVEKELAAVKSKYDRIEGAELISCVRAIVQIRIKRTHRKQLVVCFQFLADYPRCPIVVELKSKTLHDKLLNGLTRVVDEEARKLVGQAQILPLCRFVRNFIDENPLCVCSEEISKIKRELATEQDEIKLKQKQSQLVLRLQEGAYKMVSKLSVPDDYPTSMIGVEISDTNFSELLKVNFVHQAGEIARQCIMAPIRKTPKDQPFDPKPALFPVAEYLVKKIMHRYPNEICPICGVLALPAQPEDMIEDDKSPKFVERVYCGHLFHQGCLNTHMKTPPFTGGKKCPTCDKRIFHEKWKATPQLAEARWAHQEARRRELDEVVDFLQ